MFRFFVRAGLYPNYLISFEQKTWYHKLLLNAEFPYSGIQEGSVGLQGLGDSDIPQPTMGFPHFRLKLIGPTVRVEFELNTDIGYFFLSFFGECTFLSFFLSWVVNTQLNHWTT